MKLRELRGAIRKSKGNPTITVELSLGVPMTLTLQKTPLLAALGEAYGEDAMVETGLDFNEATNEITGPFSERTADYGEDVLNGEDSMNESLVADDDPFADLGGSADLDDDEDDLL